MKEKRFEKNMIISMIIGGIVGGCYWYFRIIPSLIFKQLFGKFGPLIILFPTLIVGPICRDSTCTNIMAFILLIMIGTLTGLIAFLIKKKTNNWMHGIILGVIISMAIMFSLALLLKILDEIGIIGGI